jgi:hypothetical protein
METAKQYGINILRKHTPTIDNAVMFDIDDTLIFYDRKPNIPIIELARVAKIFGYKIIIITARPNYKENRSITVHELKQFNIPYDLVIYTSHQEKAEIKQKLNNDFILSVGDMWTDLTDSKHWIKLPSKHKNESKVLTDVSNY